MRQNPHVRICGGPGSATTLVYPTPPWGRVIVARLRALSLEAWARTASHGEYSHYSVYEARDPAMRWATDDRQRRFALQRHGNPADPRHACGHGGGRGRRRAEGSGPDGHPPAAAGGGAARQSGGALVSDRHDVQPGGGQDAHPAWRCDCRRLDGACHPGRIGRRGTRVRCAGGADPYRSRHLHASRTRRGDGPGDHRAGALRPGGQARPASNRRTTSVAAPSGRWTSSPPSRPARGRETCRCTWTAPG